MANNTKDGLSVIISDLRILVTKCTRDVQKRESINADLYLNEYNDILDKVRKAQPEMVSDITQITRKHYGFEREDSNDLARLFEIDTAASKLLARLEPKESFQDNNQILQNLDRVFTRFHQVVRQLRDRHDSRATIDVKDEYDVQDLLHALLRLYTSDVRKEEWTPSYAGSSARMDFLLKEEQVVVETKKTRENLRDKGIGEELMVDAGHYAQHPDCKTLVCFIYDPEGFIANPVGLENDLKSHSTDRLQVKAYIYPK